MLLAAHVNGLSSMGNRPWYVKADYQTFDADGKPKDKGVFEEWWAGPEKYKISYTSSGFNQVLYHDGGKSLVTGDTGLAPLPELMVRQYLFKPLPEETEVQKNDYREKSIDENTKSGKVELKCIQQKAKFSPVKSNCFGQDGPYIRVESSGGGFLVVFNDIVKANGHYIAKQVNVQNSGLPIANLNVTALEFPSRIEDSVFAPPPSAVAAKAIFWGDPSVIAGKRLGGDDPHYPVNAKINRIQGTVILSVCINKAGVIDDLQVVSGPEALRKSSFDAVKTWKYKPSLLNGEPVEIESQINMIYTLGQ